MTDNGKYEGLMPEKLESLKNQLGSRISSKLIPTNPNDETATLVDAFNIDWEGYKLGDNEFKYTTDLLSYINNELNSRTTDSGEIWDDIKGNHITTQINIYASYISSTESPGVQWQNEITPGDNPMYDGYTSYSSLPAASTSGAEGWCTSIDDIPGTNQYVFMSSIYKVTTIANEVLGYHGPASTPIYLPSANGINGNYTSTVFVRTNVTPQKPEDGAYYDTGLPRNTAVKNTATGQVISGKSWSDGIPEGKEKLWASTAIIKDTTAINTVWGVPRQMTDTETYDVEFALKQTNDATPAIPDSTNSGTNPSGTKIWYDPTNDPSANWTAMYWRAERQCINGEWGNWIITRIKGEQGQAGLKGPFVSTVFKRSESKPSKPLSSEGTYDNPVPNGWDDGIPGGIGPVWSTWKTFTASSDNGEWYPVQLVADTPTYDVEFSPNKTQPTAPDSTNSGTNPSGTKIWFDPTADTTLPSGVTWESMIWRAERSRATSQDDWGNWVITKIKGENGIQGKPADYFEQRWKMTADTQAPSIPVNTTINYDEDTTWKLTPQYNASNITWLTARKVIYEIDGNAVTYMYDPNSDWSNPMRMNGIDGVANPIHPVLKYTWHTSYITAPACATDNANPNTGGITWIESPGNGSATTYLWMIQGERHNSMMQEWDTDANSSTPAAYWSAPVCLSGKNGEPGADGDDIEFIYHRYDIVPSFSSDNNNPAHWDADQQDDYLGPEGYEWNDHPEGVTSTYKYEYCAYRRKTGTTGQKRWGEFSTPFAWSIYGENGLDGDGVEYIYYINSSISTPTPPQFDLDPASFQKPEAYTSPWFDDPQPIDDTNNRYQYISTRKYKKIDDNNKYVISEDFSGSSYTIGSYTVNVGEKIWFPYSKPELWNWYINDGTIGDKYVMIYTRYSYLYDGEHFPVNPNTSMSTWTDHPENPQGDNKYLWMSGKNVPYNSAWPYNGTTETWSDPICLTGDTGENGSDGADGTDVEFIYYRTNDANNVPAVPNHNISDNNYQTNDWPFVGTVGTDYYLIDNTIKTLANQNHDTWSDNPFGISSNYKYEYCAIRRKNNEQWGEFSPVFLWSKFGEDGLDGDGVEYIYYVNSTNSYINPPAFDLDPNSFQRPEVYDSNNWHDDPQNLNSTTQSYQFVSSRKFRTITNDNKSYISSSFTGNSYNYGTYTVNVGDKIWFPYSDPTLWNWYTKDGTSAPRIVMIYRRNNSGVNVPSTPIKEQNGTYIISTLANGSQISWAESPGSSADGYSYLWMTSAHYNNVQTSINNRSQHIYTLDDNWQTPVCLTGEAGHDGEDGTNIEFIYFRTSEDNNPFGNSGNNIDPSILSANQTEDYPCNSTTEDDISFYDPESKYDNEAYDDTGVWSYMLHDVWTDNPIGVTSEYDYEWCAIRTTANVNGNAQWQTFGKPFLWSKYGEDGIDGDGIEYIFFKSADENEVVFSNDTNTNNPNKWDMFDTDYQTDDFYGLKFKPSNTLSTNWWADDPQGVDMDRRYEYVSKRKTITKNELFNIVGSLINPEGNPAISTYDNFITAYENGPYDHGQFDSTAQYWNAPTGTISSNLTIGELIETCYELFKQKKLKFWGKFSTPALWSRYAVDGLVVNLTLESDNDMMAVAIDDDDVVTDSVSSVAKFELTHNTRIVDTSYYSMHIRESNMNGTTVGYGDDNGTTYSYLKATVNSEEHNLAKLQLVGSSYTLTTNIPEGFDMTAIDNELRISSYAYIIDNTFDSTGVVEVGTERPFTNKVQGLHLSIDDIYQIQTDKNVIKVNGSELEKVTVYLKSLTSNDRITTTEAAKAKHLYLYYDNYKVMPMGLNDPRVGKHTAPIGEPLTLSSVTSVVEHTFRLYYDPEDTFASSIGSANTQATGLNSITAQTPVGTPLDIETVQRVFDGERGNPGVDSKSMEYIYFVTDDISYFTNSQHDFCNPSKWSTNDYITNNNVKYYAYNTDDFPFVGNITSYHGWEDTQIGISEEYPYQFTASRSFNTTTERWEAFSEPVCTHNWGHSGEDGDGVEYIYYICDSSSIGRNLYPVTWSDDNGFQSPEYIKTNSGWSDNPTGVSPNNKYEYVSVRKYRNINQDYLYNILIDSRLREAISADYDTNCRYFDQDEEPTLLEYVYSVCENYINNAGTSGGSQLSSIIFDNYQSDYYDDQIFSLLYANNLYQYFYNVIPKYFTPVLYSGGIDQGNEHLNYFKLEQKSEKFWGPYSEPKLWAKYGENGEIGPAGPAGGSGLTFEFDNPSIQVAVNSNGLIKDNQNLLSYLHVYAGEREISEYITSVSFDSSSIYQPFNYDQPITHTESGATVLDFFSRLGRNLNDGTLLYSCYIGDLDINNNGIDDYNELNNPDHFPAGINMSLNDQLSIPVTITYNTIPYNTHLTFTPIHYGEDGADAELFELSSETSVIRYNAKSDNLDYEPDYVEYKIHHVIGNNDETQYTNEIISYTTVNNDILNNGSIKLYYHLDTVGGIQQHGSGDDVIIVDDQVRPNAATTNNIYGEATTSTSASGFYTEQGATIGGTKSDVTTTSYFVDDVTNIQTNSVVVIPVREVEIERNTASATLLTYLDQSLGWNDMFTAYTQINSSNSGNISVGGGHGLGDIIDLNGKQYDRTDIASVAQALNDYADYLDASEANQMSSRTTFNIADVRNTAEIISNVATSLGTVTTDGKTGNDSWAINESTPTSIYVNDSVAQEESTVQTSIYSKVEALGIQQKQSELIQAQIISEDLVEKGTASTYYNDYASPVYTKSAGETIDNTWELLTMSGNDDITFKLDINNLIKNRQNWSPAPGTHIIDNILGTVTLIKIRLVYDDGNDLEDSLTIWDEDSLEIVYDGIDGVDSDTLEYIYYCPADTNPKTWSSGDGDSSENPANWTASQSVDYFPSNNQYVDDGTNGGWADHPHGVDAEHLYEYYSIRTKNGTTGRWGQYETPVVWSHFGENGRDGDGVEYIFWRPTGTSQETWDPEAISADPIPNDPRSWDTVSTVIGKNGKKFQDNEYLGPINSPWTDDPTGVTAENSYEYVSKRKYNGATGLWGSFSMPTVWAKYGQDGKDGEASAAVVLDWNNDNMTIAVNSSAHIKVSQHKSSILTLYGGSPTTYIGSIEFADVYSTLNYSEVTIEKYEPNVSINNNQEIASNNVVISYGRVAYETEVTDNGLMGSTTYYYYDGECNSCRVRFDYVNRLNSVTTNATIPEGGAWIDFNITLKDPIDSNINDTVITKRLNFTGQHFGDDGSPAITYEIIPSVNSLVRTGGTSWSSNPISYTVNKYNGSSVTTVTSGFSSNFRAHWESNNGALSTYSHSVMLGQAMSSSIYNATYIDLKLYYGNKVIDRETIPVLRNGAEGAQGFTGPIVRMRGEYVNSSTTYYGNGEYNKGSSGAQYDGVSPLYIDIVTYTNNLGTKYYTPKTNVSGSYISSSMTNTYLCTGSYYVSNTWPTNQAGTTINSKWTVASQYDFIATKLLYADQALINQISSHDFIATTQDGTPVAGMTSGKKDYGNTGSLSLLNNANGGNVNTGGVSGNSADTLTDTSHVRIFAGKIWNDNNSYSLTYAPFNVRQDGTTYMSKANIIGDVNIGGNVDISGNVDIHGSNVKIDGDVKARSLTLSSENTFFYNTSALLPSFNVGENKVIYIMHYNNSSSANRLVEPYYDQFLWMASTTGLATTSSQGETVTLDNGYLYTLYSGCGTNPITGTTNQKFWIITKSDLFIKPTPTQNDPPSQLWVNLEDIPSTSVSITGVTFYPSSGTYSIQYAFVQISITIQNASYSETWTDPDDSSHTVGGYGITNDSVLSFDISLDGNWTEYSSEWGTIDGELNDMPMVLIKDSVYWSHLGSGTTRSTAEHNDNTNGFLKTIYFAPGGEEHVPTGAGNPRIYNGINPGNASDFKHDLTLNDVYISLHR